MTPENEIAVLPPAGERASRELCRWFGSEPASRPKEPLESVDTTRRIDWTRVTPLLLMTSRVGKFIFGLRGASTVQSGPIWWAAHHRHHHVHSDKPQDLHSPMQHGFFWSHMGWFITC